LEQLVQAIGVNCKKHINACLRPHRQCPGASLLHESSILHVFPAILNPRADHQNQRSVCVVFLPEVRLNLPVRLQGRCIAHLTIEIVSCRMSAFHRSFR